MNYTDGICTYSNKVFIVFGPKFLIKGMSFLP